MVVARLGRLLHCVLDALISTILGYSPRRLPPNTTPLGYAVRAIEGALVGGKRLKARELREATRLPRRLFRRGLRHMLATGELVAEGGAYELQEVEEEQQGWDT